MKFNLIDEKWIPVKRRDGTETRIAPWQVTDGFTENPIVSLNAPRPDFNGALIQFLIGLVQTTFAPANRIEWKQKLKTPPSTDQLKTAFMTVHHAFELGEDWPRFMQDFEKLDADEGGIDGLLINMPGESTQKKNTDHFVKRNSVASMCASCCATALFAMQTNAPEGGRGYLTSLRGGGPLTTLVLGDEIHNSLWHTLWLNTLVRDDFLRMCGNSDKNTDSDMFPWLGKTRTGIKTSPVEVHPAQMYWGMPRRIRLNLEHCIRGQCDTCGNISDSMVISYREKIQGNNYKGAWLHPLSPFFYKDGVPSAIHAQPGGVSYRHWLGFVQEDGAAKQPARVVHEFRTNRQQTDWQFRLWAFGYDMESNKPRCWYEATIPLLYVAQNIKSEYEHIVAGMIKAAFEIAKNVRIGIKKAWFKRHGDVKGDTSFVDNTFWQNTERFFYESMHELKNALESGSDGIESRKVWHETLCREAVKIFDAHAWNGPIEDADPKRVVIALNELEKFNRSNKIKELLGLPVNIKTSDKRTKKKKVGKEVV